MKTQSRFIKSITTTAKETTVSMPWERGARRAAFAAKRKAAPEQQLKRA